MLVETEKLYAVWEEEILTANPPSKLYHLGPIGIGTPLVESLTSYISRLANAHSVLLRTLVTDEILPNLIRTHLYQGGQTVYDHLTSFWKRSAMLNGTCLTANNWVQTVEQLTQRSDLRFLTMLTFANVLSWRELIRQIQAWCPICYEEWRKTGQVIYQPLIWQLSVIYNCPQHHTPLQLHCPYKDCGRPLPPLAPRFQPGYCTYCDRWLGNPLHLEDCQPINRDEQEWQYWVEQAVGELLAAVPDLPYPPRQEVFPIIISTYVNSAMEGNFSEFARRVRFHRRTVWEWAQGLQVPQLDALLQICSYFGISPVHLLIRDFQEGLQPQQKIPEKDPIREQPKRQFRKFETERLRYVLEQVLCNEEYPLPSVREVAQSLNYDQSHLRKHFPDLCHAISARYLAYQHTQGLKRLRRNCSEVQQTVKILFNHGSSTSERQIGKMLRKRGTLREEEVRKALKSSLRELGRQQ